MLANFRSKIANIIAPEIVERRNHFERIANTDALTGLANRYAFDKANTAANADGNLCFIIFDLNNFGQVNKKVSHKRGDEILINYASVIECAARKFQARAFRYGGDEFVIICRKLFAVNVREAVERRALPVDFVGFTVSVSGELGETLEAADSSLQQRKAIRKGV